MNSTCGELSNHFGTLANEERRKLITILDREAPPCTLRDLALGLVTEYYEEPVAGIPSEEVTGSITRLHHVHLAILSEADIIEYDEARLRVVAIDRRKIDSLMDVLNGFEHVGSSDAD